jgi:hypothetical protein
MKIKRFQKKRNEDKESAQKISNFDKLEVINTNFCGSSSCGSIG